jgi:hypothetical protein
LAEDTDYCNRDVVNSGYLQRYVASLLGALFDTEEILTKGVSYNGCAGTIRVDAAYTNGTSMRATFNTTYGLIANAVFCNAERVVTSLYANTWFRGVQLEYEVPAIPDASGMAWNRIGFVMQITSSDVYPIINVNATFTVLIHGIANASFVFPFASADASLNQYGGYYNVSSGALAFYQLHRPEVTYAFTADQCGTGIPRMTGGDQVQHEERFIAPSDLGWGFVQATVNTSGRLSLTRVFASTTKGLQVMHQCGRTGDLVALAEVKDFTLIYANGLGHPCTSDENSSVCYRVVNTPTLMKTLLPCMPELSVVGREVTSVTLQYYPYDYLLGMTFENERGAVLSFVNRETVSGDALPSTFTLAADCTMAVPEVVWAVETHGYRSVLWRFSAEVVDLQSGLSVAFDARSSALRVGHASVGTAVPLLAVAERDVRYDAASQQQDAQCAVACAVMAGTATGWQGGRR